MSCRVGVGDNRLSCVALVQIAGLCWLALCCAVLACVDRLAVLVGGGVMDVARGDLVARCFGLVQFSAIVCVCVCVCVCMFDCKLSRVRK